MSPEMILQRLEQLEAAMAGHGHWQQQAPQASALASREPFCLDTLEPLEWLQWLFIPRMQTLIAAQQPLPQNVVIAPYFEMALPSTIAGHGVLLHILRQIDALFTDEHA